MTARKYYVTLPKMAPAYVSDIMLCIDCAVTLYPNRTIAKVKLSQSGTCDCCSEYALVNDVNASIIAQGE